MRLSQVREGGAPRREGSDFLVYAVGRPLMLVFWTLVLWGTAYAALLVHGAITSSPSEVWRRATGGRDALGVVNIGLAAVAMVVWGLLAWARVAHAKRKLATRMAGRTQRR